LLCDVLTTERNQYSCLSFKPVNQSWPYM